VTVDVDQARRDRLARQIRDVRATRDALHVALDNEANDHAEVLRQRDAARTEAARLRAALGLVKVAMSRPDLLAPGVDIEQVVDDALSDPA
jgi:hypothetical protein